MPSSSRAKLVDLLTEIVAKYRPSMVGVLDSLDTCGLTDQQLAELRELVGSELCETGFNNNDEPNDRGLLLEELIDLLGGRLLHGRRTRDTHVSEGRVEGEGL